MAGVLTNNKIVKGELAPLVGVSAVAKIPQFKTPAPRVGNATIQVPSPLVYSDGLNARRYRYTVLIEATTTTSESLTFAVGITDTAGTTTSLATSGAILFNTSTGVFFMEVEFVLDANAGFPVTGRFSGYTPSALIAVSTLNNKPAAVYTGTGIIQIVPSVVSTVTDATAVITFVEQTLELL